MFFKNESLNKHIPYHVFLFSACAGLKLVFSCVCMFMFVFSGNSKTKAHPIMCLGCVFKEFLRYIPYHVFLLKKLVNQHIPYHVFLLSACVCLERVV